MNYKTLTTFLKQFSYRWTGKYPHRYKAYDLRNGGQPELVKFLTQEGFFRFHVTNSGKHTVYYHQIVAFFCCGGKQALANGFTCSVKDQEIHHLDSVTSNNHPSNLVYITSEVHSIVTSHQRALHKYLKKFAKGDITKQVDIWNRKGKAVVLWWEWIGQLLIRTMTSTAKAKNVPLLVKQFGSWLARIVKRLKMAVNSSFVPTTIINYLELDSK